MIKLDFVVYLIIKDTSFRMMVLLRLSNYMSSFILFYFILFIYLVFIYLVFIYLVFIYLL